jgi:oligosaccharide repeat unit polymerase
MAVIGVLAMWLGTQSGLTRKLVPSKLPQLKTNANQLNYVRALIIVGTLFGLSENLPFAFGEGARQFITILISLVPLLGFALLFRRFLKGEATLFDKAIVFGFLALRLVIGLSSGWLGSFASIILICAAVYISEKRKIPRAALAVVVLFTLFFQVGKQEFRRVHWKGESQSSKIERVRFWTETSLSKWANALSDPSGVGFAEALNTSLSRLSLLTQTANVIDLTPSTVPYQQWRLYSYMAVTWIPRAIWPEKPSMNDANQFYQVAYGLSTEEGLENVSIGVGVMTEAYISFGWLGVFLIMFLMGLFYSIYQEFFFTTNSGLLMTSMGIALLPQMISIESQMAAYLGGLLQQIFLTLVIFLPVIRWRIETSPRHIGFVTTRVEPSH